MQLLKGTVIGLGILILLAAGLLAYGFYQKSQDPEWRLFSSEPQARTMPAPLKAFGDINLDLPEGCVIKRVRPDGDRTYLTIVGPPPSGACNRIVVIDMVQGKILGIIKPGK